MFAWDDIAVFLALYRERTTGRAATALGCSQPTVVRRIAALEKALGLILFDRTPTGLAPTDAALQLCALAEQVERAACEFTAEVDQLTGSDLDILKLTFIDLFERLLLPVLRDFRTRWPSVQTQLLASDRLYDLARGEADIGIRGRHRPASDEIVVRQLPPSGWTIYASSNSDPDERPHSVAEVAKYRLALIEGAPSKLPVYEWLQGLAANGPAPIRCTNYGALKSAIASGAAVSALPCTAGDGDPDVVPCFAPIEEFDVDIYLLARRAILRRPPARDLFDSIESYFRSNPNLLTGERD